MLVKASAAALIVLATACNRPVNTELRIPHRARTTTQSTEVPVIVAGDIQPPSVLTRIDPDFSRCEGPYAGSAIANLWIRSDGTVERASVKMPINPCIDRAVIEAVRQWKFYPAMKNNVPLAVIFNVPVRIDIK